MGVGAVDKVSGPGVGGRLLWVRWEPETWVSGGVGALSGNTSLLSK